MVNHQIADADGAALSADDLAVLRAGLREQRLFRREQLQQLSRTAPDRADAPPGPADPSRAEVRAALAASARMVLTDVEDALTRMDKGGYGVCHLCRGPIARDRLLIVPQARFCARCQQVREVGR
ncbi:MULTISPECIES: TraR/DksA family transcriptional regulator [Streptomyces]|uniref:TraR/DksA family transcriptional regulator n=1 Tax=Streptomyces TaxID=1883 RepID=UPI00081B786C|nr:TraR/DksA C4-type zinc finger protein [Streptomyces sp. SolWspMP-5a-2]MYQ65322.1 hypothetical protein [Streptomyces sp. SID4950]SCD97465.1 transcriptional regulator, TraR/DksA family [Streptomyces sp. SolWspMP-5a-2]